MKEFLKPTLWKIVASVIVYIPTTYIAGYLITLPLTMILEACSPSLGYNPPAIPSWCEPVNYLQWFASIFFRLLLVYILACTVVKLYKLYVRQRALLEAQDKLKNSQSTENEEHKE